MNRHRLNIIFCFLFFFGSPGFSSPLDTNEHLSFISCEQQALEARFWLINQAREEILISYFIFEDDGLGMLFLQELFQLKKNKPWLKINVIVDATSNGLSNSLMYHLLLNGIQIKEFHPLPKLRLPYSHLSFDDFLFAIKNINQRMHDKLMIIDSHLVLSGGRNIEESYFGMDEKNFHDLDVLINSNYLGKASRDYFNRMWGSKHVKGICPAIDYSKRKNYQKDINRFKSLKNYMDHHPEYQKIKNDALMFDYPKTDIKNATFYNAFPPGNEHFEPQILSQELFEILSNAKSEIIIETPYLLGTKKLVKLFETLIKKGVEISIITNSFCSTDISAIAGAYDMHKIELLETGVKIYEYLGNDYLHTKCALVDNKIALVGTFNLDPRSIYTNTEVVFFFHGQEVAKALSVSIEKDLSLSDEIILRNGKAYGGLYTCDKSIMDLYIYLLMQVLSKVGWIYKLL